MSDRLLKESDVLKAIDKRIKELSKHPEFVRKNGHIDVLGVKKYILAIPSADRPIGEWVDNGDRYYRCSLCGTKDTDTWDWCHGCGCRMKGADDDSDNV